MSQREVSVASKLFSFNWFVIGSMGAALALASILTGFSIKPTSALWPFGLAGGYILVAFYKARRSQSGDPLVFFVLGSTGQILLIPVLGAPLTYIVASANLPLQDTGLNAIDHALGLDWLSYFEFIYDRRTLLTACVWAYAMIGWPTFGVPVVLGLTRRFRRLQEFTLAFALALIVTIVISIVVPAMGTYDFLKYFPNSDIFTPSAYLDQLRDLPLVRNGTLRQLDLLELGGIVTFPSFHAAAAVLYLWAFWAVPWMRLIALLANIAMLLATPVVGGHYFVDVFAGIAVAVGAILAARQISTWATLTHAVSAGNSSVPSASGVNFPVSIK